MRNQNKSDGCLKVGELNKANELWTKYIQDKHFTDTINALIQKRKNNLVSQLGLYLDSLELLRCGGRFINSQTRPIRLPKKSHFTNLIVRKQHQRVLHGGVSQTLAAIRNHYWIIHGRSVVRKLIRQCLICIHWEGGPFKTPKFAHLPNYVITPHLEPFTNVGLDYLGPLLVKSDDSMSKNWVCLFTCLNIRGIH